MGTHAHTFQRSLSPPPHLRLSYYEFLPKYANTPSFPIGVRRSILTEITIQADLARMIAIGDRIRTHFHMAKKEMRHRDENADYPGTMTVTR